MAQAAVGVIGLGIMGSAMSHNLMRAGFPVIGFDILPARRKEHARAGGKVAKSAGDVARRAGVIVTALPSARALGDVSQQIAEYGRRGVVVIETSTLPIPVKKQAREVLAARGVTLLDSPLSGTGAQARAKDLITFVSGERAAHKQVAHVMDGFTRAQYYVGPFGDGSKIKYIANMLVAIHNVSAAEAMVLAMKAGLDPALVLKVVSDGAGTSRMLEVRGPVMVKGDYSEATMKVSIWQKDMTIIGDFLRELDFPAPLFAASAPIYNAAMAMGRGAEDTAAVCAVLEEMAGSPRRARRKASRKKKR